MTGADGWDADAVSIVLDDAIVAVGVAIDNGVKALVAFEGALDECPEHRRAVVVGRAQRIPGTNHLAWDLTALMEAVTEGLDAPSEFVAAEVEDVVRKLREDGLPGWTAHVIHPVALVLMPSVVTGPVVSLVQVAVLCMSTKPPSNMSRLAADGWEEALSHEIKPVLRPVAKLINTVQEFQLREQACQATYPPATLLPTTPPPRLTPTNRSPGRHR